MNYEKDIIRILKEAGRGGLSVRKIATHVYNAHTGFFETPDFEEVVRRVYSFLRYHSQNRDSIIEHTGRWGVYRLNMKSLRMRQLMLQFKDNTDEQETPPPVPDRSLSLFD